MNTDGELGKTDRGGPGRAGGGARECYRGAWGEGRHRGDALGGGREAGDVSQAAGSPFRGSEVALGSPINILKVNGKYP